VKPVAQGGTDRRADSHACLDRAGPLLPLVEALLRTPDAIGVPPYRDEAIAECAGGPERRRSKGGHADRDRAVQVNDPPIGVKKSDGPHDVAFAILDRVATEEPSHRADIIPEVASLHRPQAHRPPAGVAGSEAEDDTSRIELVDSGDRVIATMPRRGYRFLMPVTHATGVAPGPTTPVSPTALQTPAAGLSEGSVSPPDEPAVFPPCSLTS
jgi:hypothetical protein